MSMPKNPTGKRLSLSDRIQSEIAESRRDAQLDSWNAFVDELKVPSDLYPALTTNRPELLSIAQPRALTAEECDVLYKLIGGLMKTNSALRRHAERVSQLTGILNSSIIGALSAARSIDDFANFRVTSDGADESEGEDAAA